MLSAHIDEHASSGFSEFKVRIGSLTPISTLGVPALLPMELNGRQRQEFQEALLSAFPDKLKLAQMLCFELDWELDAIAGGQNQTDIIFNLINHARANGQLSQLLSAAASANPGSLPLRNFAQQFDNTNNLSSAPKALYLADSSFSQAVSDKALTSASHSPIKVFVSYSHKDEAFREELDDHLSLLKRQGKIDAWNDRAIEAGSEWQEAIEQNLKEAQIILLLISAKFIASDFCYCKELTQAMARHSDGTACVIPIILKPCDWKNAPFSKLQVLPRDGKAINTWHNRDEAFVNIVQEIRRAIASLEAPR